MTKKMLIDAAHPEETRVVVVANKRVEEFDFEASARRQIRANIYLAKVTRVEPSLQAAFVDYGGNRHGFLAFNEIHPDYYQIPFEDRQQLIKEIEDSETDADSNDADDDDEDAVSARASRAFMRRYKIQEVIKRRQILLVQVAKEERGNKGAALTTYLSLAGRYGVLMPNTARGGGISRKITSAADRKRLRTIVDDLNVPDGMGLIVRTAGAKRTKGEIKRDYEYLLRLWENIRNKTLESVAPCLIHEESNLVKRAVRDLYDKDIEEIMVEGESAYREAKDFIRMLMPSHAKKVQRHKDERPLFLVHGVEKQLEDMYNTIAPLPSGGYLVINQTEALVAIDVNSGKSTRERNVEATALKTNLEAAEEACRQFRLRDLAGLIVIDFIDMEEAKNNRAVEKRIRDHLKRDRARVQVGKISNFGLMEMSRQRRRASIIEGSHAECPTCHGQGTIRTPSSSALHVLRCIEEYADQHKAAAVDVRAAPDVVLYVLNQKRTQLAELEARCKTRVNFISDETLVPPNVDIQPKAGAVYEPIPDQGKRDTPETEERDNRMPVDASENQSKDEESSGRRRRRRRGGRNRNTDVAQVDTAEASVEEAIEDVAASDNENAPDEDSGQTRRRRRRGRRGGRNRRGGQQDQTAAAAEAQTPPGMAVVDAESGDDDHSAAAPTTKPLDEPKPGAEESPALEAANDHGAEPKETRSRSSRRNRSDDAARSDVDENAPAPDATETRDVAAASGMDEEPRAKANGAAHPADAAANDGDADDRRDDDGAMAVDPAQTQPAEPDPDAENRRKRWQDRLKSWVSG